MRISIVIIIVGILLSCKNKNSINIHGVWKLDSSSGPSGKLFSAYLFLELSLKKDNTFNYSWREGDNSASYKGKFNVRDSTTKFKILDLITDTLHNGFQGHFRYIIVESNNYRFKGITEESYTTINDSLITFDRIDIFKKQPESSSQ